MADAITKLLRKLSKRDQLALLDLLKNLKAGVNDGIDIKSMKGGDYYRARKGNFRIIFHKEKDGIQIDAIRRRSEKTYKDF